MVETDGKKGSNAALHPKPNEWRAPKPNEWKSISPMTSGRCWGGVCVNDHQFLVIGQSSGRPAGYARCEYYDTHTEKWKDLPIYLPLRQVLGDRVSVMGGSWDFYFSTNFGVASLRNQLFVMGGCDSSLSGRSQSDLISIDIPDGDLSNITSTDWQKLAPMKYPRKFFACVSHSKHIYVFGGANYVGMLNGDPDRPEAPERYDTETNEWTTLPTMPGGRRTACAAAVVGNKIYVVGGWNDSETLASVIVFDTSKQQWESLDDDGSGREEGLDSIESSTRDLYKIVPDMKTKRYKMVVEAVDNFLFVIGGMDEEDNELFSIEVLNTETNSWKCATSRIDHGRYNPVIGFLKETNEIILAGGTNTGDPKPQTNAILTNGLLEITRKRILFHRFGATFDE